MIRIKCEGKTLTVEIDHLVNGKRWTHHFGREEASDFQAEHVARSLRRALENSKHEYAQMAAAETMRQRKARRGKLPGWYNPMMPVVES